MKNRHLTLICAAVAVLAAPLPTLADVAGNIAVTTKYKYRGQDQSDPAESVLPAVQGGFDYSLGGFYLGNWNSSVGFLGGTEMDFYGGYRGELGPVAYDVGLLHYYYPGATSAADTTELYGSVGYGPVSLKYSSTVSSKYFGIVDGQGTGYLEVNAKWEATKGLYLIGHYGTTQFSSDAKAAGAVNYSDFKVGIDYDLGGGFTLGGAYAGANKKSTYGDINKSRFLLTVTKAL